MFSLSYQHPAVLLFLAVPRTLPLSCGAEKTMEDFQNTLNVPLTASAKISFSQKNQGRGVLT